MTVRTALYTRLSTFAGLAALVGIRIYPLILPQGSALPAVTYQVIATQPREMAMGKDPGIARPRFQVTAWAPDADIDLAWAVAEQIRLALERWSDPGNQVDDTEVVMQLEDYEPQTLEAKVITDFRVTHREAV